MGGKTVVSMGGTVSKLNLVHDVQCSLETINGVANEINAGVRDSRFDKVREIRFKSRFFFLLGFRRRPGRFFQFFRFSLKIFCENGRRTYHLG